eukprot:TRINITY_DN3320_c0_g2_i3.p2 TRINITY_DN3320_c0_g2~~TRINITY_DN3320_c0_g2_i3.p2  ORF type:complete len:433 (-),score=301.68 TRINITY_DN3320_c0_g2_i3:5-1303(-)
MAATAALGAVCESPDAAALVQTHYALLLASLAMRVGTAQGSAAVAAAAGYAAGVTAEAGAEAALRAFVERSGDKAARRALDANDGWSRLASDDYTDALTALIAAVAESRPAVRSALFECVAPYCKGNFVEQRCVAVVVIGELVQHTPVTDADNLLARLVQALLAALIDPPLKRFALRGLGNVVTAGEDAVNHYAPTVLDALTSSMEHADESIVLEAMGGLSKVFSLVEEARVQPILVNICHRIRPAFGKLNDGIRAEAFRLFGTLARFGDGAQADAFYEQWHANLPLLVLHAADDARGVVDACREALGRLAPLARDDGMTALLTGRHLRAGRSLQFAEFLDDFATAFIAAYPRRVNPLANAFVDQFHSQWDTIKGNAAAAVARLLHNVPVETRPSFHINAMLIARALVTLLADRSPAVRRSVAGAMALLHTY